MTPVYITALVMMVISFLPLVICVIKIQHLKKYKAKAIITTALVTASQKRRGVKNSTYYLLNIQYIIHSGVQYSGQTISWKKYIAGDNMPLMYLANEPGNFKTDFGKALQWLLPVSIVLIVLMSCFCCWLLNLSYTYKP